MKLKKCLVAFSIVAIMLVGCMGEEASVTNEDESDGQSSFSSFEQDEESNFESGNSRGDSFTSEENLLGDDNVNSDVKINDPLKNGFESIENPFLREAADPFIAFHEGKYYYIYSTGVAIYVSTFDDLKDATNKNAKCVFNPVGETEYSRDIWAPEMHFIDGYWYIYFAACDGNNENHRMFVLKSKTEDALGEYEFVGKICDDTDKWAIDGTVFTYKDEMYFVWSGWMGNRNVEQRIYIAKMSSPTEISSPRTCISIPTYDWEKEGGRPRVNEGPAVVTDGEYLAIVYSASGSWCDDYCLGQLTFTGGNLLSAHNWEKNSAPILQKDETRFFGPGHCSFVKDKKDNLWMVFHANLESGTGWNGRSGWMYPIRINEKGMVEVVLYR